jgi:hypothetical protein
MPDDSALAFYAAPAPMTQLPWATHAAALADLPADVVAAAELVRGVLVHRDWAPLLGLQFDAERLADQHLRSVGDVVARVVSLHDAPLTATRPLPDRMVGVCRHFTTLHVALLRDAGIPARARVGFARYFEDSWVDHWVTEWWDGRDWVRTDPQVGPQAAEILGLDFDPNALPPGQFIDASEAWSRCRAGDEDPQRFGIFDLRGLWFVSGNVLQDLAACNKVELLPWDVWGSVTGAPGWQPTDAELARLDAIARTVRADDLSRLRARFAEPDVAVPETIISIVDDEPVAVTLERDLVTVAG